MVTRFAACDVAPERRGAAVLDRRHNLQSPKAQASCPSSTPSRAVVAEDVRDLERLAGHARDSGGRLEFQILQWALHLTQQRGRDLTIAGGVLELLMPQEHLDHADVLVALEQMRRERMAQRMQ